MSFFETSIISQLLVISLFSYILGAIPFALVVSKLKGIDLRSQGSGNLGATNVYRIMGVKYAFFVFFMDGLKAFIPTSLSMMYFENPYFHVGVGVIAVLAHSFTIFASFKGGKGVASSIGMLFALNPIVMGILLVLGMLIIYITRFVSLASIVGSFLMPFMMYFFNAPVEYIGVISFISLFVIIRHRSNILRLIKGTENKI